MHIIYIFINHLNMGYAPGLALGRRWVNKVSNEWLRGSLLHEDLLLVLLNDLLFFRRNELYQLVIYMHEMMMQKLALPTKVLSYLLLPLTSMKHDIHYLSN